MRSLFTLSRCRSLLLSIGADAAELNRNASARPDILCVDLEDTVADKTAARRLAVEFHRSEYAGMRGVRINPLTEPASLDDIQMLRTADWRPDVLVLTKLLDPFELRSAEALLPACPIVALIETAEGLEKAHEIATASDRVAALMFGGKDMALALGARRNREALAYARGRTVAAAAAAGIPCLDETHSPRDDLAGLEPSCRVSVEMGFAGRLSIEAAQIPGIHRCFPEAAS